MANVLTSSTDGVVRLKPFVAVAQMTSTPDKEATFAQLAALVEKAKFRGAQMVFFPEYADFFQESIEQAVALAEHLDGPTVGRYRELARRHFVWLSIGGFHEKPLSVTEPNKIYNTQLIIDSEGAIRGIYRKLHLFDVDVPGTEPIYESSFTLSGRSIAPPVACPCGKVGMSICYDMRFPELAIALVKQGAEILSYPSAFTVPTGMAHWEVLLRNRAIENQCYVIAAAQVGQNHANRSSYGNAMIIDPWGTVVTRCSNSVEVGFAEIDLEYLTSRRQHLPAFCRKRHDVYSLIRLDAATAPLDSQPVYQFGHHSVMGTSVFYKTSLSFAFVSPNPDRFGHVLICPLRVVEQISDMTAQEVADLFLTVQRVSQAVKEIVGVTSLVIVVKDGASAKQTIKHIRVQVFTDENLASGDRDVYLQQEVTDTDKMFSSMQQTAEKIAAEAQVLRSHIADRWRLDYDYLN